MPRKAPRTRKHDAARDGFTRVAAPRDLRRGEKDVVTIYSPRILKRLTEPTSTERKR